jgi:hypothetical protein
MGTTFSTRIGTTHPYDLQVAFALGNINPSDELYRTVGLWIVAWGTLITGIAYASGHAGTALGGE